MFKRASGQDIPDREFDFDVASDSEHEAPKRPQKHVREHAGSDLDRKPEWTMKNEGPGLESSDEDENDVGCHGEHYTMAELRIMAKWISRYSATEWADMTPTRRWEHVTQIVSCMNKTTYLGLDGWKELELTLDFYSFQASYEDLELPENAIQ